MNLKVQIPNAISASRIGCGVAVLFYAYRRSWRAALGWLLIGEVTDNADGRLARAFDVVSPLGSHILEPVGDTLLVKLAQIGLIHSDELTWTKFWWVSTVEGVALVPRTLLPGDHPVARRCDTVIGFVYAGEMLYCSYQYAKLAEARLLLRFGPASLPVVAWLCRRTLGRWLRQLN